jgi:glycosyltransferase involved in cell wall biosynthesis
MPIVDSTSLHLPLARQIQGDDRLERFEQREKAFFRHAMPLYSFIVAIYNDASLAESFCEEFVRVMRSWLKRTDIDHMVELIFVNDGSTDNSQELLVALQRSWAFVRVVEFSRNFGHHMAVSCGYQLARGDYVGLINVDMQDPPDQIPVLLDFLKTSDCDVVIGLRAIRRDGLLARSASRIFFATMNFLADSRRPSNPAVLRVMTRRFVDAYNLFSEQSPYVPGLEEWLGFKQEFVAIAHRPRSSGKSSYTALKRIRLALDAVVGFSDFPLRLTAGFGFLCTLVGFTLCFILVVARVFSRGFEPGYTSTVSVVVFLGGVQILSIGLLSLYVGRILREVQKRPRYIVKSATDGGEVRRSSDM